MTTKFDDLNDETQSALLAFERFGHPAAVAFDNLKMLARHQSATRGPNIAREHWDADVRAAIEHVELVARDHLVRLTAGYELQHRVAARRTAGPANKAMRALGWTFGSIADWRREWIESPYQTIAADGTLMKNGVPVGGEGEAAVKLGVAGSVVDGPRWPAPSQTTAVYLGRTRGFDVYALGLGACVTYSTGEQQYSADTVAAWRGRPHNFPQFATDAVRMLDSHLAKTKPCAAKVREGGAKRWGVWMERADVQKGWCNFSPPRLDYRWFSEARADAEALATEMRREFPDVTYEVREYVEGRG